MPPAARAGTAASGRSLRAVCVSLRPHQWTKNLVVFAALALLQAPVRAGAARCSALLAFAIFCGALRAPSTSSTTSPTSSATGCTRASACGPIASGALSARGRAALRRSVLGLGCLGAVRCCSGRPSPPAPSLYLVLNLLYSFRLKEIVILDVLAISLGFVLRAVAGGVAIARRASATGCSSARCCSRSSWPWPSGATS